MCTEIIKYNKAGVCESHKIYEYIKVKNELINLITINKNTE